MRIVARLNNLCDLASVIASETQDMAHAVGQYQITKLSQAAANLQALTVQTYAWARTTETDLDTLIGEIWSARKEQFK